MPSCSLCAGNFPERICQPMADEIAKNGGEIRTKARLQEIVLNEDETVKHFLMQDGSKIEGDLYVSAMPGLTFLLPMQSHGLFEKWNQIDLSYICESISCSDFRSFCRSWLASQLDTGQSPSSIEIAWSIQMKCFRLKPSRQTGLNPEFYVVQLTCSSRRYPRSGRTSHTSAAWRSWLESQSSMSISGLTGNSPQQTICSSLVVNTLAFMRWAGQNHLPAI